MRLRNKQRVIGILIRRFEFVKFLIWTNYVPNSFNENRKSM